MLRMLVFLLFVLLIHTNQLTEASQLDGPQPETEPGEPLILTPLLEEGRLTEAQRQSKVTPTIGNMTSYSGYFTVNKACESNLFFWYFPAQKNREKAPLVLFLQGGPGVSSIYSIFEEVGPLTYKEALGRRKYSWNVKNNLLFIDQPVGTGYSFTKKGCYAQNETVIGEELYSAIFQFLQLFPNVSRNKFYITGYSYAGHFIPALGYTIHKKNPTATVKINLSGMMIGDGYMDAYYQNDLGSQLYQLGLIDIEGRNVYYEKQEEFSRYMEKKDYQKAVEIRAALVDDIFTKYVGNVSTENFLNDSVYIPAPYEQFIQRPDIRKAIHVGNTNFSFYNEIVDTSLGVDAVISVKPYVEEIIEHYFIVFYNGQLDIICSYPALINFLIHLDWSGKSEYQNSTRHKWCVEDRQAGFFKGARNVYDVLVRNAGHSVAFDQQLWAYDLVNAVTSSPLDNPVQNLKTC